MQTTSNRWAKDLYGSRYGELCFIIGMGKSLEYAKRNLSEPHPHTFRIAINRAIEHIPADYWFWIDLEAYDASKDHPNAKAAVRIGVDHFKDKYDPEVYVWERILENFQKGLEDGKLAHRATSLVAAASFAMRLGAYRIVFTGCDNKIDPEYIKKRVEADPTRNWGSIYSFTFARIQEAFYKRHLWMDPKVMMADASKNGTEWGALPLPKTTLTEELKLVNDFYQHLWATGKVPKKQSLIARP